MEHLPAHPPGVSDASRPDPVAAPCAPVEHKAGEPCPHCEHGRLEYNGCLNLHCPRCSFQLTGAFT